MEWEEVRDYCQLWLAINAGKDIAFVNKEVMVMCGPIVMSAVKEKGVNLIPIDGEMSAIFQCLEGARDRQNDIHRLISDSIRWSVSGHSKRKPI